ncbi:hypothetical protein U1Q18_052734 [Sarracenia purpurea var. burkii]
MPLDSSMSLNRNCSVDVVPKGFSVSGHEEKQVVEMSEDLNKALHVLEKMPKSFFLDAASVKMKHLDKVKPKNQNGVSKRITELAPMVVDKKPPSNSVQADASQAPSWASIVATDGWSRPNPGAVRLNHRSGSGSNLEYLAPLAPGVIEIEDKLVDEQPWEACLVRYFLNEDFAFGRVRATAMSLWKSEGLLEVHYNDSGFFFFKFSSRQEMENVLDRGPWHFYGKLLILRK